MLIWISIGVIAVAVGAMGAIVAIAYMTGK